MQKTIIDALTGEATEVTMTAEEVAKLQAAHAISPEQAIRKEIRALEAEITARRLREAVLGDSGWLSAQEAKINALRGKL